MVADLNDNPDSDTYFFYFSYGSNLLKERIHVGVPGADFISVGVLNNFDLLFFDDSKRWKGALASIEPKDGSRVFGCIWRVPYSLLNALDRQEIGYHRLEVHVLSYSSLDRGFNCLTYQYSNTNRVLGNSCGVYERKNYRVLAAPSPHYKEVIVAGAVEHELPTEYIERLRAIPTNGFNGTVDLDLKAIKHLNGNEKN